MGTQFSYLLQIKKESCTTKAHLYNLTFLLYYNKKYTNTILLVCLALSQVALHSKTGSRPVKEKEAAEWQISL